jgi:glycosyltransferase involved in cell wall biosynthesis
MSQRNLPAAHILSFAQTLAGGGVERALLRMAGGWAAAGRRVTLVIGDAGGALAHELPPGVDLRELHDGRYRALFGLPGIVRELAPDLVFCPGNHYTAAAFWLRSRLGAACPPIIGKVSNALVRPDLPRGAGTVYRLWLRRHRAFLDTLVAMTPAMAREAAAAMSFRPEDVHVIPNPAALPIPDAPPPPMPEVPFILGVGRLAPQKRWDRLIEAIPRLRDSGVKLLLLGEGAERAALTRLVERCGLAGRVILPGHASDPLPAIARASVVALTSEYEGVPGVLREAIALGTPVVATESSIAIPELIDTPEKGTIVPIGDRVRLVAALNHWLAPGRVRPEPHIEPGPDPIAAYLRLFDMLADQRRP